MNKPLRILAGIVLLGLLLLAGAAAYVLLFLDPNDLKPRLAELARRQGIALEMRGDLAWDFLPRPGIEIGSTRVRSERGELPEIDFESATLSMAWLPLLRGEPRIEALRLEGAEIRIANRAQAGAAAAAPVAAAPPSQAAAAAEADGVVIGVRSVSIRDTRVIIATPEGDRELRDLQFTGSDILLDGTPFPIRIAFDYRDPALPFPVGADLQANLGVDQRTLSVSTRGARLQLTPEDRPAIAATFDLSYDGSGDLLEITALDLRSQELSLRGEATVAQLGTAPQAHGKLEIPAADPRPLLAAWQVPLPAFSAPDALERVALGAGFRASPEALSLSDLEISVDDTRVTGDASIRLATPRELRAELHGDRLDLGRYRGPDTEQTPASPPTALLAPLAAPMAFLQGGTGSLALDWDLLTLDQLRLEALRLRVRFAGDELHIEDLSSRTLGGTATLRGRVEGIGGRAPEVHFAPRLKGIALAEVRRSLAPNLALDGVLDLTLTGSARGDDAEDLQQSLRARGDFRVTDPLLAGTNIERTFCDLVATVERTPKRDDWPDHTRFETIAGSFRLAGPGVTLDGLTTGIGNLALRASGTFDRATERYEVTAVTRLAGDRTSPDGCPVRSGRLRDRDIPLRCTGSMGAQTRTQCVPEPQFVAGLVEDRVLEELRERGKLEGERGQAVEGLLKGLLNRGRDGD